MTKAEILLEKDLKRASRNLTKVLKVPLNQNQFDAVVCLVYDVGIRSVIVLGMIDMLNTNDFIGASLKFRTWSRYKKTPVYQLIMSRKAEMKLFDKPIKE